jgi:hypothetical protein
MQVFGIQNVEKATIIGGILSMVGGFSGALGAYFVASYQMNKQIEHEKKKVETLQKAQIKKTLKKLQLLNKYALRFVETFPDDFNKPYNEELGFKLKSSEMSILWIANSINDVNDELLNEGYMLDYIKFNQLMNHTYNEIIVFNNLPEEQKTHNLVGLINALMNLKKDFNSFEEYTRIQLENY